MADKRKFAQDSETIGSLVAAAGRGATASPEARERIYAAVREHWQNRAEQSGSQTHQPVSPRSRPGFSRSTRLFAMAASVASVAVVLALLQTGLFSGDSAAFPVLSRIDGDITLIRDSESISLALAGPALELKSGDILHSASGGQAEMQREDGLIVRINVSSELELSDGDRIQLNSGTLYVDSGMNSSSAPLQIVTPLGEVQHLGTQYEVDVADSGLRVRVREGLVSIDGSSLKATVEAGEQLDVSPDGNTEVSAVASNAESWNWATDLAALPEESEYRLSDVLAWIARERGLELEYISLADSNAAEATEVLGLEGMNPIDAMDAITRLTETQLETEGNRLLVSRQAR